ncbi:LPD38 domain-containing protein [Paenibacillus sp. MER 78]|uniref:LPD38 domain-containing protein n=1 Tax=Paenibacillus sp. MER 78 TaxID=2939571 RepID=UPI00203AEA99|nr:LPD38 domain-containing protein [Paenibacillus sp. MER 78]MCM3130929.1 hypothetical protein [Paenibacillus sp. MER 78]
MASKYDEYRKALGLQPTSRKGSKYDQYRKALGLDQPRTVTRRSTPEEKKPSKYDNYRMATGMIPDTRPVEERKTPKQKIAELPDHITSFGIDRITNSDLYQATQGNRQAINDYKAATGREIKPIQGPPTPSQHQLNENIINTKARESAFANAVAPFSRFMNDVTYGNPVGQFVTRSVGTGGGMLLGTPSQAPASTGNQTADRVADVLGIAGGIAGAGFNPSAGGNLITAPLRGVSGALNTRAGQAITGGVSRATRVSQPVARAGIEGAATGAIGGVASGLVQGQDSNRDILTNAGLGAGLGAVGDIAARGIGNAISRRTAARTTPDITARPGTSVGQTVNAPQPSRTAAQTSAVPEAEAMRGNWFTNLFGNTGVGISPFSSNRRVNAGPLTTADQIVRNSIRNDAKGLAEEAAATARAGYQNFVDRLSPLKRFGNETYEAAMDTARSNNLANTVIRDKFVTPEGTVIGEGLNNIFKKVQRGQDDAFVDYITLRHARTRVARGERVYNEDLGMTPEKIQERIDMYDKRYPGFAQIADEWDGFNDNVLQTFGVNEGLITQQMKDQLREQNPNYSPMRRQFSRSEKPGKKFIAKSTSSSFSGQKAPLQKVSPTGSVRDIVDPRKTTVEMVGSWTNAAMNNRVMQEMVGAISRDPDRFKGIAEIVQKPDDKRDLRSVLFEGGMDDFAEEINSDFRSLFNRTRLDQDNIVRAMVNGEPVYLQVHDPEVVKTLMGMGPQASNLLLDFAEVLSNATKRGATGALAPIFAVKGATMDLVQSAIQAKNPAKQAAYTVYGILSGIGDRLNIPGLRNLAQDFRRSGGEYSAALKGDRKLNRSITDMTRDPLLSPRGVAKGVRNVVAAPFRALEEVGNIAENAPRMAAFKQELDRLGGERTPENVRKAMDAAREVTVNFSRRGAKSRDVEALIPYNNAAVQGTYRIFRAFKENPKRTGLTIAAVAVLPKIYEYTQFADDEDYQKLPARERYRNLFISKNADGTFIKIPMEPAYNSFGQITISALQSLKDGDPQAFKGAADALASVWLPPVATGALQGVTQGTGLEGSIEGSLNATIAAPFVATTSNRSFTGAPIESRSLENYSPENRYDERTSSVAIQLGQVLNMSPKKIDYLIRAYGGDPARMLLPLTSEQGSGNVRNTLLKNFIADPEFTNNLSTDFYNAKDNLNQAYYDSRDGRGEAPEWYSDEIRKLVTSQAAGSPSKRLSDLNKEKREIGSNKSLSAKQKADRQREVQRQINEIYIDVNQQLEESGVPLK